MDNLDGYFNLKEGAKYQVAFWNCHFNIHTTVQPSLCLGELRSTLLVDSWVQGKICEVWKSVSSIICDDGTVQYSVILYTCPYSISVTAILYTEVNISCRVRVHFITPQLQTYVKTEWYPKNSSTGHIFIQLLCVIEIHHPHCARLWGLVQYTWTFSEASDFYHSK